MTHLADVMHASCREHRDRQAVRTPDGNTHTYATLWRRAGALQALVEKVVGRSSCVAFVGEPSLDLYAFFLAVCAGGLSGVILSPRASRRALEPIVRLLDARVVIMGDGQALATPRTLEVLPAATAEDTAPLRPDTGGSLFSMTSGSLGWPTVAQVDLQSLGTFAEWSRGALAIEPTDRWFEGSDPSTDLAFTNAVMALSAGACVYLPSASDRLSPAMFAARHRITSTRVVPSIASTILLDAERRDTALPDLKLLAFGGDAIPFDLGHRIAAMTRSSPRMLATYGKTEAAGFLLYRWLDDGPLPSESGTVALDRALPGTQVDLRPTDFIGETVDELVLTTPNAALKVSRYGPDGEIEVVAGKERAAEPAVLWTRDAAVRSTAGIEIIGRIDRCHKVRGTLVNLGHVELLAARALGRTCFAAVIGGELVLLTEGEIRDLQLVNTSLAQALPAGSGRARVHTIDALPRNRAGKLDLRACEAVAARRDGTHTTVHSANGRTNGA
jgi:D-alanine--poly(phosphoribitol) ligase subunit 1